MALTFFNALLTAIVLIVVAAPLAGGLLLHRGRPRSALLAALGAWCMIVPYLVALGALSNAWLAREPNRIVAAKLATGNCVYHGFFALPALVLALGVAMMAGWKLVRERRHARITTG